MRKTLYLCFIALLYPCLMIAQNVFAVNGFCIAAPDHNGVQKFVDFIENELASAGINTLVLRVDFNYAYTSRPELQDENPLSKEDVKKIIQRIEFSIKSIIFANVDSLYSFFALTSITLPELILPLNT